MKDFTTTSFGLIIAYLLPGLVALLSLSPWSNDLHTVFKTLFSTQSDAALVLAIGAYSLVIGLILNVFRWALFEKILCRKYKVSPSVFSSFQNEHKLQTFLMVIEETFRYHQFYGAITILMPFLYLSWLKWFDPSLLRDARFIGITFVFIFLEFALGLFRYDVSSGASEAKWVESLSKKVWPRRIAYLLLPAAIPLYFLTLYFLHYLAGKYRLFFATLGFTFFGILTGANAIASQRRYSERVTNLMGPTPGPTPGATP